MRIDKKILNTILAFAIAIPMIGFVNDSRVHAADTTDTNATTNVSVVEANIVTTGVENKYVGGADLDLLVYGFPIAYFTTDSNGKINSDNVTVINREMYDELVLGITDGKLNLKAGDLVYTKAEIKERKAPLDYELNTKTYPIDLKAASKIDITVPHTRFTSGAKFTVVDANGKPISNVILDVTKIDNNDKFVDFVVSGVTNTNGTHDRNNLLSYATKDKNMVGSDGTLNIPPGRYKYSVAGAGFGKGEGIIEVKSNSFVKKDIQLTAQEKKNAQELKDTIMHTNTAEDITIDDNNKQRLSNNNNRNNTNTNRSYNNNTDNTTKKLLAKTGSENPIAYTLTGLALAASGAFIFMKK